MTGNIYIAPEKHTGIVRTLYFLIYILLFVGLNACSGKPKISPVLSEAERLMNVRSDSSLLLLKRVESPEKASKEQYALWCLLITQAQDKQIIKHTSDSIINVAIKYFDKTNNIERRAQAYYCRGRVFSDMMLYDEAIASYLKAEELVVQTKNYNLQARIFNHLGDLYRKNFLTNESLVYYQKANDSYKMEDNLLGVAYTFRDIGLSYMNLGKLDSSLYYLNQSLKIVRDNKWKVVERFVLICLGNVYESMSLYSDAIDCIKESLNINQKADQLYSAYYSLGRVYNYAGKKDSAYYYWEKALKSPDVNIRIPIYRHYSLLAYQKKEYEAAFNYNEQYLLLRDSAERIYRPQKLAEINARYDYERLINEKNQIELRRKKTQLDYSLIIMVLLILVFASMLRLHKKKQRIKENKQLLTNYREQLQKSEWQLEAYKLSLDEKEQELLSKQNDHEEIVLLREQVVSLKNGIDKKEVSLKKMHSKFKSIVSEFYIANSPLMGKLYDKTLVINKFSEKDWSHFDKQLNFVYPDFMRKLRKICPQMSSNEFRFCCMYLLGIKTSVIADALGLKPNTISKYVKDIEDKYFRSSQFDSLSENLVDLASKSIFLDKSFWVDM